MHVFRQNACIIILLLLKRNKDKRERLFYQHFRISFMSSQLQDSSYLEYFVTFLENLLLHTLP